jgi:EAL domain-containing protein (putative c-di-GMP-specific phosphodiesterase class I)
MMRSPAASTDLEAGLRHAVERHEIVVHYQPIVNITVGSATQVEALVRWHRADELIPPLDFIPAAESSGLINTLGQAILELACSQVRDWLAGDEARSVAVNVSAVQLREPDFARDILTILAATGVDPRQLIIEVTESACLGSPRRVIEQLSHMRERGIRVALDDFGTGYSTLARLRELPVDIIKVDKSFIDEVKTGRENLPILNSIIDLGHTLGLHVTVEGVETATQARQLRRLGSDSMQGFYFGRPSPVEFLADMEWQATNAYRQLTPASH